MRVSVAAIGPKHFERHQVWEYCDASDDPEVMLRSSTEALPVDDPYEKVFGLKVTASGGPKIWALFANVDSDTRISKANQNVYLFNESGEKFKISSPMLHQIEFSKAVSEFLSIHIDDVFPISYDLSPLVKAAQANLYITLEELFTPEAASFTLAKEAAENYFRRQVEAKASTKSGGSACKSAF